MSLKDEFLNLLERDREFRYAVAGYLGLDEILKRLDRNEQRLIELREDMIEGFRRHDEILEKHSQEIVRLREDMIEGFNLLRRHIDALGARWGIISEQAFREGLRGIVEKELGLKVEKWVKLDVEGYVFGYPSMVDVDIAVHDEKLILVEIKSHASKSDVYVFKRKVELYEKTEGRKPSRLLIITPYIDEDAVELAGKFQIEVYTKV